MFSFDGWSFAFVFVNLLVLYFGLRHFLWKPVNAMMDKRQEMARSDLEKAATERREAEALKLDYEKKIEEAKGTAAAIVEEARKKSAQELEQAKSEAHHEAEAILKDGKLALQIEREKLKGELREEVSLLALGMASKIIEENADTEANRALLKRVFKAGN